MRSNSMDYDYMMNPQWDEVEAKIQYYGYDVTISKQSSFALVSKTAAEVMPKIVVEIVEDPDTGITYFNPDMYAPALLYDDVDDGFSYWVKNRWAQAADLCSWLARYEMTV